MKLYVTLVTRSMLAGTCIDMYVINCFSTVRVLCIQWYRMLLFVVPLCDVYEM